MRTLEYTVDAGRDGMEAGAFLKGKGYSRAMLTLLKRDNGLLVNGQTARTVDRLKSGDTVSAVFRETSGGVPNPELDAGTIYDDEDIVVFDKPAGMPVHTSFGHDSDTLENLFAARYPDCYFHAVSRLDRNTSGLIIAAKHKFAAARLMSDPGHKPEKVYYAVAGKGIADKYGESGEIAAPIARENDSMIKRTVRSDGVYACTRFRVAAICGEHCLLEVTLVTGRTHQIRVHFSYAGFPLLGDDLYGGDTTLISRQALHCGKISFRHPVSDKEITLISPLPDDISGLLDKKTVI